MSEARERLAAAQEDRRQRGLHPKGTDQTYEEQTRVLMTWTKAELVRSLIREESDKLKATDQLIDARSAQVVPLPDREALAQVAGMIRRNCTPSTEAYQRGGDALIYAVADWVENPPEWVLAALPTKPAAGVTEDALADLRESIEQELELGGDASTLVPAVTEWLKRTSSPAPLAINRDDICDAIEDNLQNLETSWRGIDENSSDRWLDEQPLGLVVGMAADAVIAHLSAQTVEGEVEKKLRAAAHVAYPGPKDTDAGFMRIAADHLEGHYEVGGSRVRAAVVRVLRVVAEAIEVQS